LAEQSVPAAEWEILVLDNSPDHDISFQQKTKFDHIPGLRWWHVDRPGVAHARNCAIAYARAGLLAFIDDDVTVTQGWLAALLAGFAQFGDAAHSAGGPVRPEFLAPKPDWLAEGMLPFLSVVDRGAEARLLAPDEWIPTANAAFRTERLRAVGGFREALGRTGDEATLMSNEDTEVMSRLHRAGGASAWVPDAAVWHRIDSTRLDQAWFRRRFAWQAVADTMVHPAHHRAHAAASWREVEGYLAFCAKTGVGALSEAHTRADLCHWQMSAIYHLTLALLSGVPQAGESEHG
jgi:GT2 family glycosyltransferase